MDMINEGLPMAGSSEVCPGCGGHLRTMVGDARYTMGSNLWLWLDDVSWDECLTCGEEFPSPRTIDRLCREVGGGEDDAENDMLPEEYVFVSKEPRAALH